MIERIQAINPEAFVDFEPGTGVLQRGRIDPAHPFPSPRFARHEPGALKHAQVFRHRCERNRKWLGEMADGGFPLRQAIKDGTAGGIGKRPEDMIETFFNHLVESIHSGADTQPFG